jgi:uncharacterized DUF497 family protein
MAMWFDFFWTDEAEEHLAEHGVTRNDFEHVVSESCGSETLSRSTGRPVVFGYTEDGRYIACVFDWIDDITIEPVTAYEVGE